MMGVLSSTTLALKVSTEAQRGLHSEGEGRPGLNPRNQHTLQAHPTLYPNQRTALYSLDILTYNESYLTQSLDYDKKEQTASSVNPMGAVSRHHGSGLNVTKEPTETYF